ncbi:MAG: tetratricopeptide repeat protein [Candidatus Omnitrophica bacterium]|nr:tetratricopeptide repeat protein [Candidatus Omnitrophota bacterium]MCB9721335.1 tetratricopeptide repeat protein [Candidatus Omnitrophota bacterium]
MNKLIQTAWFWPLLLFGVIFALYGGHLHNEYIADDHEFLLGTHKARFQSATDFFISPHGHHYIPLYYWTNISLFETFAGNVAAQRFLILLLFFGNAWLLYSLYRKLAGNHPATGAAALLFVVHPMNADMLVAVSNIFLLVYGLFILLTFHLVCDESLQERSPKLGTMTACVSYILGLMTYDNGMLFPGVLFLYFWLKRKFSCRKSVLRSLPFGIISLVYFAAWCFFVSSSGNSLTYFKELGLTVPVWFATLGKLISWYISNLFYPHNIVYLNELRPIQHQIAGWNLLLFVSIAGIAYVVVRHWGRSLKSFLLLWFCIDFIILLPGSLGHHEFGIVIEHHWFYLSSMAFYLLLTILLLELRPTALAHAGKTAFIVLLCWCLIQSKYTLAISRTEIGYARYWLSVTPHNMMALRTLGDYYVYKATPKDFDRAVAYYREILDTSSYNPAQVYDWIGNAYWFKRDYRRAEDYYHKSLTVTPTSTTCSNLAELYMRLNELDLARKYFLQALLLDPHDPRAKKHLQSSIGNLQ